MNVGRCFATSCHLTVWLAASLLATAYNINYTFNRVDPTTHQDPQTLRSFLKMPSFRGIGISIVSQSEIGRLPEYPYPEESRFQSLGTPSTAACVGQQPSFVPEDESAVASSSAMNRDSNPKVSVYIPSLPGSPPLFSWNALMSCTDPFQARNSGSTMSSRTSHRHPVTSFSSYT